MEKKANRYLLTLQQLASVREENKTDDILELEFTNHDELFVIISAIKNKQLFNTENESIEFALGLKLFSEVLLKNRKHPLFEELGSQFGEFMKKLKAKP